MPSEPIPTALVGAWRLTAWEERGAPEADWRSPLGPGADGMLLCDASGAVSFQMTAPAAHIPYAGLFGRAVALSQDGVSGELRIMVDAVHPAGFSDDGVARPFRLDGDVLTFGDDATWRRSFTRITRPAAEA
jgi:hypothetical protein